MNSFGIARSFSSAYSRSKRCCAGIEKPYPSPDLCWRLGRRALLGFAAARRNALPIADCWSPVPHLPPGCSRRAGGKRQVDEWISSAGVRSGPRPRPSGGECAGGGPDPRDLRSVPARWIAGLYFGGNAATRLADEELDDAEGSAARGAAVRSCGAGAAADQRVVLRDSSPPTNSENTTSCCWLSTHSCCRKRWAERWTSARLFTATTASP